LLLNSCNGAASAGKAECSLNKAMLMLWYGTASATVKGLKQRTIKEYGNINSPGFNEIAKVLIGLNF
jgi:hypothetical protein